MHGWARTDHFGCFGPCLNTIPFWTLHSYLFRLSTLLSIIYSIHSQCHLLGNTGDASLPRPWVHNLVTRHSKEGDYFSPIFASVCHGALSLSSSCLFSLRVLGVSVSKRADTHSAPLLNADPSLSSRTPQRDLPRYTRIEYPRHKSKVNGTLHIAETTLC